VCVWLEGRGLQTVQASLKTTHCSPQQRHHQLQHLRGGSCARLVGMQGAAHGKSMSQNHSLLASAAAPPAPAPARWIVCVFGWKAGGCKLYKQVSGPLVARLSSGTTSSSTCAVDRVRVWLECRGLHMVKACLRTTRCSPQQQHHQLQHLRGGSCVCLVGRQGAANCTNKSQDHSLPASAAAPPAPAPARWIVCAFGWNAGGCTW